MLLHPSAPRGLRTRSRCSRALRLAIPLIVACVMLGGGVLRWLARGQAPRWSSDEGISYLMSTCHGVEYGSAVGSDGPDRGRWVDAQRFVRLIESDGRLCLGTVSQDLSVADVHPPLYFWLLHVWTLAFGRSLRAGMALNVLIFGVGLVLLYRLAVRVLASRSEALAVCLLAGTSLVAIQTAIEFRPYGLLGTVSVAYVWLLSRCCLRRRPTRSAYLAMLLGTAAGLLTHYLFAFVVLGSGVYAWVRLLRVDPRRLGALVLAVSGAVAVAWLMFPFHQQLARRAQADPAEFADHRADGAALATLRRGLQQPLGAPLPVQAGAAVLGVVLTALSLRRSHKRPRVRPWYYGWEMLVLCASVALVTLAPRAMGLSPPHATGGKYLAGVIYLLPFVLVLGLRALGRLRLAGLSMLCVLHAAPAVQFGYGLRRHIELRPITVRERRVALNVTGRLHLPPLLAALPRGSKLWIAGPDELQAGWAQIGARGGFSYAGCPSSAYQAEMRTRVLNEFRQHYTPARKPVSAGACWKLYRFRSVPRVPQASAAARKTDDPEPAP